MMCLMRTYFIIIFFNLCMRFLPSFKCYMDNPAATLQQNSVRKLYEPIAQHRRAGVIT